MSEKTMKENLQSFAVKKVLHYMDEDPDKSLPKLLDWADKFDKDNLFAGQRKVFHNILENLGNNWYRLIKSLWSDIDPEVRKTFFENFIVNTSLIGSGRQDKCKEEHNCNIPWAILMDPTSACNLHCTGCWAAEYGNKLNMSYETLDDIIRQGKEMGTFMYIFSGGEPLVRKDDIIRLCEAHPDWMFLAFTNGTLIDEKFADEILRVKNFVPAISIEGFEERSSGAIASRLYVRLFSLLQGIIAGQGTDAYEMANKEMLKEYSSKYLLAGEVIFLAVDPTSHGHGIGRMLIEELSRRHKGQRIYLFTDSGCSYGFYEHMGFVRVGERDIMMNILSKDVPLKCLLYSKEL